MCSHKFGFTLMLCIVINLKSNLKDWNSLKVTWYTWKSQIWIQTFDPKFSSQVPLLAWQNGFSVNGILLYTCVFCTFMSIYSCVCGLVRINSVAFVSSKSCFEWCRHDCIPKTVWTDRQIFIFIWWTSNCTCPIMLLSYA